MGKKIIIFILLSGVINYLSSQTNSFPSGEKEEFCKNQVFRKKSIYIVTRGTLSKRFVIANEFNIADTNSTHVGIGYKNKKTNTIINVTNASTAKQNALILESLKTFIEPDDVFYCSIFRIKVSKKEYKKFRNVLDGIKTMHITFDYKFNFNNPDTLYCSELCYLILSGIDSNILRTPYIRKKITNPFLKRAINEEYLNYVPVDFYYYINRKTELIVSKVFKRNAFL
jgi:hypothetical protein